jgi:hypothetical protein
MTYRVQWPFGKIDVMLMGYSVCKGNTEVHEAVLCVSKGLNCPIFMFVHVELSLYILLETFI